MTADAAYKQLYPLQYLNKFLSQGIRPDGRPLLEGRPCTLQHGIIRCDSSCMVSIGATTCIATVKLQARIVFPNHGAGNNIHAQVVRAPSGHVSACVDLPPMCCPLSQSRRLLEDAAVATHRLQHALRSCIDPAQLCIQAVCVHDTMTVSISYYQYLLGRGSVGGVRGRVCAGQRWWPAGCVPDGVHRCAAALQPPSCRRKPGG